MILGYTKEIMKRFGPETRIVWGENLMAGGNRTWPTIINTADIILSNGATIPITNGGDAVGWKTRLTEQEITALL